MRAVDTRRDSDATGATSSASSAPASPPSLESMSPFAFEGAHGRKVAKITDGNEQLAQRVSATDISKVKAPFDPYNMPIETSKYPEVVPCFVEVSRESRNKYEWDHDLGVLTLDRVLHSAVYYPHDYGFIPQTLCGDGDPLDILVMSTSPLIPGCVVMCRPICYMVMEDEKGPDEKVLAVNAKDAHFSDIRTMKDLHEHTLREIAEFFATYKKLEKDKWAKVGGWRGTEDTLMLIKQSHENYKRQFEIAMEHSN